MYPKLEGEIAKVIKIENGFSVMLWDPEPPPAVPGQPPCSQQPVKFWKTFSFETADQAIEFLHTMLTNQVPLGGR